jgi:hypothetical protein
MSFERHNLRLRFKSPTDDIRLVLCEPRNEILLRRVQSFILSSKDKSAARLIASQKEVIMIVKQDFLLNIPFTAFDSLYGFRFPLRLSIPL